MSRDTVIRSSRVVSPAHANGVGPAAVVLRGELIHAVLPYDAPLARDARVFDFGELVVIPGLVDTHVHINEPGRTAWEGFDSATRAAAAGGITTLVDMPLNSQPSTTTVRALHDKRAASADKLWVDVGFCGGVVPGNLGELRGLRDAGVLAFKCFLTESGVDEFQRVNESDLRPAMRALAELDAPLFVHAELDGPIDEAKARLSPELDPRRYESWLASRPKQAENEAVAFVAKLARELGSRAHVVHLSSAEALSHLLDARNDGARVSAETCPHYLHFCAEHIPDGRTEFKCAPPIREAANRELLWSALGSGLIDQVVSDHSPCVAELKHRETGDFLAAWGGIASLQLTLAVVWTEARARNATIAQVSRWMSTAPASLAGLAGRKGVLAPGAHADVVVFDPDARYTVDAARLAHKNPITPYDASELTGVVRETWLRGERVYERGRWLGERRGRELRAK